MFFGLPSHSEHRKKKRHSFLSGMAVHYVAKLQGFGVYRDSASSKASLAIAAGLASSTFGRHERASRFLSTTS